MDILGLNDKIGQIWVFLAQILGLKSPEKEPNLKFSQFLSLFMNIEPKKQVWMDFFEENIAFIWIARFSWFFQSHPSGILGGVKDEVFLVSRPHPLEFHHPNSSIRGI